MKPIIAPLTLSFTNPEQWFSRNAPVAAAC